MILSNSNIINSFYSTFMSKINELKQTVNRPLTLTEKIIFCHCSAETIINYKSGNNYISIKPDRMVLNDITAPIVLLQLLNTKQEKTAIPTSIHCDHLIKVNKDKQNDLNDALHEFHDIYDFLQSASNRFDIDFWEPGQGISHQLVFENYVFPGGIIVGTSRHTCNAGGLCMLGFNIDESEALDIIQNHDIEIEIPQIIGIKLEGELNGWTSPKDVILKINGELKIENKNTIIEYFGSGAETLSATGKATICNMSTELGASSAIFPFDKKMKRYLRATHRTAVASRVDEIASYFCADTEVIKSPNQYYDRVIEINLSEIEPYISGPFRPDNAIPISQFAENVLLNGYPRKLDAGLIGSCVNSSYEDLSKVASIAKQSLEKDIPTASKLFICPGSKQTFDTADRDAINMLLKQIGGQIMANACGPCNGQWDRVLDDPQKKNSIITSFNRNHAKRTDGNLNTLTFIASPEIVIAMTIAGDLCFNPLKDRLMTYDGEKVKFTEPIFEELPKYGFVTKEKPVNQNAKNEITFHQNSKLIQAICPFDKWDGKDSLTLELLIKVKGKCTIDQISLSRPWIKYRGHLENISNNFLIRAINIFNGKTNTVWNRLNNRYEPVPKVAKDYKNNQLESIVVANENYGEGINREHAALEARFLHVRAILANSFAPKHEINLKKHGILPLTFINPEDYNRIQEKDSITISGLCSFTPLMPLDIKIKHENGEEETFKVQHTFNQQQIDWFKAGSALNFRKYE